MAAAQDLECFPMKGTGHFFVFSRTGNPCSDIFFGVVRTREWRRIGDPIQDVGGSSAEKLEMRLLVA